MAAIYAAESHRSETDSETGSLRRLGLFVALPLLGGVFLTLVLAGVLNSLAGVVITGVVIFGGTATAAVVLAEMTGPLRRYWGGLFLIAGIVIPLAGLQSVLAPALAPLLDLSRLALVAVVVLLLVGSRLLWLGSRIWVLNPLLFVAIGFVVGLQPTASFGSVEWSMIAFLRGAVAAAIGIGLATALLLLGPGSVRC